MVEGRLVFLVDKKKPLALCTKAGRGNDFWGNLNFESEKKTYKKYNSADELWPDDKNAGDVVVDEFKLTIEWTLRFIDRLDATHWAAHSVLQTVHGSCVLNESIKYFTVNAIIVT